MTPRPHTHTRRAPLDRLSKDFPQENLEKNSRSGFAVASASKKSGAIGYHCRRRFVGFGLCATRQASLRASRVVHRPKAKAAPNTAGTSAAFRHLSAPLVGTFSAACVYPSSTANSNTRTECTIVHFSEKSRGAK